MSTIYLRPWRAALKSALVAAAVGVPLGLIVVFFKQFDSRPGHAETAWWGWIAMPVLTAVFLFVVGFFFALFAAVGFNLATRVAGSAVQRSGSADV
ncbi:hypothetical protein [Ramlibacter algicola]|uniref:Uncharacterized protein n=1 Tax=Ramlibacter algicola TaxID=2795217 RepID=A0A934USQ7_9BURK|nr:hypothetical protein [Ramlibacter algicola]MBK0393742.1 hypothetical protein [Ramlibacter algicola]